MLPFYHSYAANGIMPIAFDLGAKVVTLPRFDVNSYLRVIEEHKVSYETIKLLELSYSLFVIFNEADGAAYCASPCANLDKPPST